MFRDGGGKKQARFDVMGKRPRGILMCDIMVVVMLEKKVTKGRLQDDQARSDLEYWLAKTPEERIAAVEELRRQRHGNEVRLERVARVIKRTPR